MKELRRKVIKLSQNYKDTMNNLLKKIKALNKENKKNKGEESRFSRKSEVIKYE